jgi:hypothetical protein
MSLQDILDEEEENFEKIYSDNKGVMHRFIGVLIASDDYYYAMMPCDGSLKLKLLSCVGSIESFGYEKVVK